MSFRKILIANRGEIACRVMRTAHRLGYRTVAVFSDADAHAPHVSTADEAVRIGAPPAADSYLNITAIIEAARRTGADAVHPGYGFLSERADFAQACDDAGLVFIGPPPAAMRAMGDKARAKRRMVEAGVPCAPGYLGEDPSDERLTAEAHKLGLPLLVKAVAGGGGRGMRLVRDAAELPDAIAGARREAQSAFGDGTLMLERLIDHGRHIEIQVFADAHGNAVHLGERDCTAQRRRQKVIEEAPSPVVSAAMRAAMGRDAVAAALAVGYRGAGTVEFIVDADMRHFFLEMNTRLQVEHPVTECITGLDLVEWQLRVAAGEPLPLTQEQITFTGHAIEARLYAEDPYDGWKPQTGRIAGWRPQAAESLNAARPGGVRIDHGIAEGGEVTPYYDAMVAKFVARFDITLECQGEQRSQRVPDGSVDVLAWQGAQATVLIDGVRRRLIAQRDGAELHLCIEGAAFSFAEPSPLPTNDTPFDPRRARAPVAGVVAQISVAPGDAVVAGQPLLCVEAMKMEMWLTASAAGTVKSVNVKLKDPVAGGAVLVELEIAA